MAPAYTQRLYWGPISSSWTKLYTANSARVVIRDVELQNTSSSVAGRIFITVQAGSGSPSAIVLGDELEALAATQWQGRVAIDEGDEIWGQAATGSGNCIITGYVFEN